MKIVDGLDKSCSRGLADSRKNALSNSSEMSNVNTYICICKYVRSTI